jgi:adenylate cyclase
MVNLSEYFEELASMIIKDNGTVDKSSATQSSPFWNAPLPVTDTSMWPARRL